MLTLVCLLGASFLLCCVLTPLAGRLAHRWGLLDHPDARRKLHGRPIPLAGGLAILASCCLVLVAAFVLPHSLRPWFEADRWYLLGLMLAAICLCAVGVLDDFGYLRGRHKVLGQVAAVAIVMSFGVRINHVAVFGWAIDLGPCGMAVTLLWLLGAINSLNLIDGMDGMLGCVGFTIALAMAGMAVLGGHWAAACVAATLAGALLGFLCFNLPPARIFMGDAGSMVVGLVVGVLGIQSSLKAPATVALIAPLAMLTIPFLDTAAAIIRRKLTGRSIYATDRGHLHHCLLRRGFSTPMVLAWVSLFCVLAGAGALASLALKNELIAVCSVLTVVVILIATRFFGYAEFLLVKKRLGRLLLSFLRTRGDGRFQRLDVRLHGTTNWKGLLDAVAARAFDLNLQMVRLDVSVPALHEEYHAQWDRFEVEVEDMLWRAELPLVIGQRLVGRLQVAGYPDPTPLWTKMASLARLIDEFEDTVLSAARVEAPATPPRPAWGGSRRQERRAAPSAGFPINGKRITF